MFSSLTTVGNPDWCTPGPLVTCSSTAIPADRVIGTQSKKLLDASDLSDSVVSLCESLECGILTKPKPDAPTVPVVLQMEDKPIVVGRDHVAALQFSEMDLPFAYRLQVLKLALLFEAEFANASKVHCMPLRLLEELSISGLNVLKILKHVSQ